MDRVVEQEAMGDTAPPPELLLEDFKGAFAPLVCFDSLSQKLSS